MPLIPRKYHTRTIDRVHLLVRLELANPQLSGIEVARLAGLTAQKASVLRMTPLYRTVHNNFFSGVIAGLDNQVKDNLGLTQATLKFAVPVAMERLLKQALQEKDLRVQNKACNDILDRDGHFAKVTRVGLATEEQGGVANDKDNKVASDLLNALRQQTPIPQQPSIDSPSITDSTQ
jgi:hypothetical protein